LNEHSDSVIVLFIAFSEPLVSSMLKLKMKKWIYCFLSFEFNRKVNIISTSTMIVLLLSNKLLEILLLLILIKFEIELLHKQLLLSFSLIPYFALLLHHTVNVDR
jgi:hypothetical protein